jgi:hypothetical protein
MGTGFLSPTEWIGLSIRKARSPRANHPPQHRIDEAGLAASAKDPTKLHRLVHSRPVWDGVHEEQLRRAQDERGPRSSSLSLEGLRQEGGEV